MHSHENIFRKLQRWRAAAPSLGTYVTVDSQNQDVANDSRLHRRAGVVMTRKQKQRTSTGKLIVTYDNRSGGKVYTLQGVKTK